MFLKLMEYLMKNKLTILFFLIANISFATSQTKENESIPVVPSPSASVIEDAKIDPSKLPSLGSCDPYSDYFIYQCKPFKCSLNIANMPNASREMEVIGYENGLCIHNYKLSVRAPNLPPADFKITCRLSEKGRLEASNQFTSYKKGKIEVYSQPPYNETLSIECYPY
jgi:hypothetical protein